jgi:hypothetical protein
MIPYKTHKYECEDCGRSFNYKACVVHIIYKCECDINKPHNFYCHEYSKNKAKNEKR